MPSNNEKEAIHSRLKALLDAVYDEALRSPAFFDRIERILLSPEARLSVQQKPGSPSGRPSINLLELLHRDGEAALRRELEGRTNEDLARLCAHEGVRKLKEAKSLERDALIDLLLQTTTSRLNQGESFTKKG